METSRQAGRRAARRIDRGVVRRTSRRWGWLQGLMLASLLSASPLAAQQLHPLARAYGEAGGFLEDSQQVSVLMLSPRVSGLTEAVAEPIGRILQQNLENTGHLAVTGPKQLQERLGESHPHLQRCSEIACGVAAARRLALSQVLVSVLRPRDENLELHVRLIDSAAVVETYENRLRFHPSRLDEQLFWLANDISRHLPYWGEIAWVRPPYADITLGAQDGLQIGDLLVAAQPGNARREALEVAQDGQSPHRPLTRVAVLKVEQLDPRQARTRILYHSIPPQQGYRVWTVLDPTAQVNLISETRRHIDTQIRRNQRSAPVVLQPVVIRDTAQETWRKRLLQTRNEHDRWRWITLLSGISTVYFLSRYDPHNTFLLSGLVLSLGATGYGTWQFLETREQLRLLNEEGRARQYATPSAVSFRGGGGGGTLPAPFAHGAAHPRPRSLTLLRYARRF